MSVKAGGGRTTQAEGRNGALSSEWLKSEPDSAYILVSDFHWGAVSLQLLELCLYFLLDLSVMNSEEEKCEGRVPVRKGIFCQNLPLN